MTEQENPVIEQVITSIQESPAVPETTEVKTEAKPEALVITKASGEGGSTKLECTEENKNLSKLIIFNKYK